MNKTAPVSDLTSGNPAKVLTLYAIPMLLSMFFQQAYNLVDSWIAGNHIGPVALGAVGTCYPITVFYIAIASGLSVGTSIYCSQHFGAKQLQEVQAGIATALLSFIPLSILIAVSGLILCPSILKWLAVPKEAWEATSIYLIIYTAGLPFLFLYNIGNGILNGLGNSRSPLLFLILSSICNILLDIILVAVIPMGISGVALATLLSQAAASLAVLHVVRRSWLLLNPSCGLAQHHPAFSFPILTDILRLGIPSVLQHVFMSAGQLSMQSIINSYGLIIMAGYSIAFRINGIVINSLMALSNALSGYMAQNIGAGEYGRMGQGYRITLLISYIFSAGAAAVLLLSGASVLSLFLESGQHNTDVIDAGMGFLRIVSPFYLLVCLKIISDGALRGLGAMTPFMLATLSDVIVRIAFGRLFSDLWGIRGVWSIWPIAWLAGTLMSFTFYRTALKRTLAENNV